MLPIVFPAARGRPGRAGFAVIYSENNIGGNSRLFRGRAAIVCNEIIVMGSVGGAVLRSGARHTTPGVARWAGAQQHHCQGVNTLVL